MGMAPYGQSKYLENIYKVINVENDGSFRLNMEYFEFTDSTEQSFSQKFINLFGEPRKPETDFYTITTHPKRDHSKWDDTTAQKNQYYADVAPSIQKATEDILIKMADEVYRRTGLINLCIAGGVSLNSVANGRILKESSFKNIYIQPAAGDSGGALGAALYANHILLNQPRRFVMEHAYWGQAFSPDEIRIQLNQYGYKYELIESTDQLTDRVVDAMLQQKVVGLYQGRFEWGPRALGNRSILADPRRPEMKNIINTKIKYREPFRPFAPVMLVERTPDFFDLADPDSCYPAKFTLLVLGFKDKEGEKLGAVNHFGTGRLQTVDRDTNPRYYDIIKKFGDATGIPVLLNTSFNLRGEPIVTSPENALNTYFNSGIDILILENYLLSKENQ